MWIDQWSIPRKTSFRYLLIKIQRLSRKSIFGKNKLWHYFWKCGAPKTNLSLRPRVHFFAKHQFCGSTSSAKVSSLKVSTFFSTGQENAFGLAWTTVLFNRCCFNLIFTDPVQDKIYFEIRSVKSYSCTFFLYLKRLYQVFLKLFELPQRSERMNSSINIYLKKSPDNSLRFGNDVACSRNIYATYYIVNAEKWTCSICSMVDAKG